MVNRSIKKTSKKTSKKTIKKNIKITSKVTRRNSRKTTKKASKKQTGGKRKTSKRRVYKNKLYDTLKGGNPFDKAKYDKVALALETNITNAKDIYNLLAYIKTADEYIWNKEGPNKTASSQEKIISTLQEIIKLKNGTPSEIYPGITSVKGNLPALLDMISKPTHTGYVQDILGLRRKLVSFL